MMGTDPEDMRVVIELQKDRPIDRTIGEPERPIERLTKGTFRFRNATLDRKG